MAGVDDSTHKLSLDQLNSKNYTTWKFKLKHLLIAKDLWEYVDGSIVEPEATAEAAAKADYKKKANRAMSTIVLSVNDGLLYLITECTGAKQAWDKLQAHFERDTLSNKLFLKKRYFRSVMREGSSAEDHMKYMKELSNKLAAINAAVSEEDQVVTLLGSLPDSYSTLVIALETCVDDLSLEYVQQALINEDQRRGEQRNLAGGSREWLILILPSQQVVERVNIKVTITNHREEPAMNVTVLIISERIALS